MVSRAPQSNANNADASDRSLQASSALPRSTLPQGTVDGTSQPPPPQQQLLDSVFLAAPANDGSSLPSPSPQMSSTPASSPTSPSTCQLELQMNFKGGVPDQADTNKILRFYRVPGSRFKSVEELFAHHGYQIEGEKFAQGEYSQLFRARYTKTGILVACKQIDLAKTRPVLTSREMSRSESTTALAYIKNELHMLKILSEQPSPPPYIIKLYNHFVVNQNNASNTLYVFLKLAPEGSLAQYVHRCGPLTEPAAATIFSQLTVALEYLHLKGRIAHRDVKLEAVLLLSLPPKGDDPKLTGWSSTLVMLTNFGASRTVTTVASGQMEQGQGQQQGLCHTACAGAAGQYTPPELLDEKVLATSGYNPFLVDVWMAGITLYGMVCYPAFPFPQEDTQAQLRAQCSRAWRWPPTVKPSPPLHALLWAMLQPDPAARIRVEALAGQQWLAAEYKTAVRRAQQPQPQPQPQQPQQKQQSQQQQQPQQQAQPKQQQQPKQPKQSPLLPKPAQEVSSKKLKSIEKSKISGKIKSSSSKGAKSGKKKSINSGSGSSRNKSSKAKSSTSKSKRSAPTQVVKSIVASKRSSKSAALKSTTKSKSSSSAASSKSNKKTTKSLGKTTSSSAKSNKK